MRMEWEGLLQDQVLQKELTMFGIYKDASGRKDGAETTCKQPGRT
jgi:hypothetical protein